MCTGRPRLSKTFEALTSKKKSCQTCQGVVRKEHLKLKYKNMISIFAENYTPSFHWLRIVLYHRKLRVWVATAGIDYEINNCSSNFQTLNLSNLANSQMAIKALLVSWI